MPKPKRQDSEADLLFLALSELDQSVHKPNILNYGEKDYPEQLRFHKSPARGRFVSGGNRGGKTDAEVVESIWWATDTHPYLKRPEAWGSGPLQLRFVVVDISKGVEQIILPKMKRWIPKSYLINESWDKSWDGSNLILTFANGSIIDFVTWGMDMMKLGGVPRHGIFFDEEPPQHIFNESMMRLVDYNGFWVIAATPTKGMGWTFDLLWEPAISGQTDKIDTFTLSAEQNPYIQAKADDFDFYMMGMDREERLIRESGQFVARSGLVFPSFNGPTFESHVVDLSRQDIPRDWAIYASVDHGWNNPTAWLWHAVGPNGDILTFAEHYMGQMTVAEHSSVVKQREREWGFDPEQIERSGDPAMRQTSAITGTSILMEYALNEVYINVDNIPRDVVVGIEKMQAYFRPSEGSYWGYYRPKWVISRNCTNFLRELKKLRWATYSSDKQAYELNKQEVIHKKDDHACFPAGTLIETSRGPQPIETVQVGDTVLTRNGYRQVLRSGVTGHTDRLYRLGGLSATGNHPVWTDRGWVAMDSIRYSDRLLTWTGLVGPVGESSEPADANQPVATLTPVEWQPVYNLTVDQDNEFFANGILVHNCDSARYFATTRPDLSADSVRQLSTDEQAPVTLRYEELLLKMRDDPDTTFASDRADNHAHTAWETETIWGDYYGEDI